jgi:hypothetical protein
MNKYEISIGGTEYSVCAETDGFFENRFCPDCNRVTQWYGERLRRETAEVLNAHTMVELKRGSRFYEAISVAERENRRGDDSLSCVGGCTTGDEDDPDDELFRHLANDLEDSAG